MGVHDTHPTLFLIPIPAPRPARLRRLDAPELGQVSVLFEVDLASNARADLVTDGLQQTLR